MPDMPAEPHWRVLFTPRWISWHVFAVVAVVGMLWLGDWQLRRALSGNTLSWAYTFEWPIFAVFGVVFWVKTVRDELRPSRGDGHAEEVKLPAGALSASPGALRAGQADSGAESGPAEPEDIELAEYNAYLARLSKETRGHGRWHGLR